MKKRHEIIRGGTGASTSPTDVRLVEEIEVKGFDNPPQRGLLDDEGAEVVDPLSNWYKSGPKGVNQKKLLAQKDHGLVLIKASQRSVVALVERAKVGGRTLKHGNTARES